MIIVQIIILIFIVLFLILILRVNRFKTIPADPLWLIISKLRQNDLIIGTIRTYCSPTFSAMMLSVYN
jgi:hypothetical protein